jgi:hypothetical protein
MSPFIIAGVIMFLGMVFGAMVMWWYMDGRVEFWQDKYIMERRLKEHIMKQSAELLEKQLSIVRDLGAAFQVKPKAKP